VRDYRTAAVRGRSCCRTARRSSYVQRATMHVGTRRYLGRSRCRVVSISIWVASKCALARRQPAATRRQPSDRLSGRPERRGRGTAPPAKQRPAEMPAASTTREALKTPRGSRPQSAPAAGIECVSTAHRPPSKLTDATPIDSAPEGDHRKNPGTLYRAVPPQS
jgi:hypothetical protein